MAALLALLARTLRANVSSILLNQQLRDESRVQREVAVKTLHEAGDLAGATTLALRLYGVDVARFLSIRMRRKSDAEDAFSQFCEDMWRGITGFDWRCSLRTWLLTLAQHAAARLLNTAYRRREAYVTTLDDDVLPTHGLFVSAPDHVRAEVQDRVRALRLQLPDEQQTLLTLRIDRALSWRELAVALDDVSADADELELQRASARLRTRFGYVKRRLRQLAAQEGLFGQAADAR